MTQSHADERIASLKIHLESGIADLSSVVIGRCEGTGDLNDDHLEFLRNALHELLRIRDSL